jgi:hypothetical protein
VRVLANKKHVCLQEARRHKAPRSLGAKRRVGIDIYGMISTVLAEVGNGKAAMIGCDEDNASHGVMRGRFCCRVVFPSKPTRSL